MIDIELLGGPMDGERLSVPDLTTECRMAMEEEVACYRYARRFEYGIYYFAFVPEGVR